MKRFIEIAFLLFLGFAFTACPDPDGNKDEEENNGGTKSISSGSECEAIIRHMANIINDHILYDLSNGTFNNVTVNGLTGTATVNGSETSTGWVSCGYNCISSTYRADIDVNFTNFKEYFTSNGYVIITGPVSFYYYSHTTQSGTTYSSSTDIDIASNGGKVTVYQFIDYSAYHSPNSIISDSITFSATNDSLISSFNGTCTPSNGKQYAF